MSKFKVNCVMCANLEYHDGCSGYSEWTPGYPAVMRCLDGHFDIDDSEMTAMVSKMRDVVKNGCEDFEETKEQG